MYMCRLSIIFHQILIHVYDPVRQSTALEVRTCVASQGEALNHWWDTLPDYLRIEAPSQRLYAPPSHIVTLKYVESFIKCRTCDVCICVYWQRRQLTQFN